MKRFWKIAEAAQDGRAWGVELDGKPLRTPARAPLQVPTQALALAIAEEWNAAPEQFEPGSMPLTGLANAALDRVGPDPDAFARSLAEYGESDLTCYRAEGPRGLVASQEQAWDPLLAWARRRFDVDMRTTCGIVHVPQTRGTTDRLAHAVAALDPLRLAGLSPLVTIGGSLVAALAVLEDALAPEQAWDAVSIDERWQIEKWGANPEAEAAMANRERDFLAAARFLDLLG